MKDKSKNIIQFANQLSNNNKHIETVKRIKDLPFASLNIYNGSGEKVELTISKDLKPYLHDFLMTHFEEEKQKLYFEIQKEIED